MGNKAGWIVAGVMLLAVLGVVVYVIIDSQMDPAPSAPTAATTGAGALDFKEIAVPVATVLAAKPSAAGNAADDYARAVTIYQANQDAFKGLADKETAIYKGDTKLPESTVAVLKQMDDQVAAGATKASMNLCLPTELKVGWRYRPADGFSKVGNALVSLAGDYYAKKQFDQAEKVLQHVIIMGMHMIDERAHSYVTWTGKELQMSALLRLAAVYFDWDDQHKARVDVMQTYAQSLQTFESTQNTKLQILQKAKPAPGDVFNIADNDKDKAWRIHAILTLGVVKFVSTEEADRKYAQKLITKYCASQDPLEQAAATAAQAFTKDNLQSYANNED